MQETLLTYNPRAVAGSRAPTARQNINIRSEYAQCLSAHNNQVWMMSRGSWCSRLACIHSCVCKYIPLHATITLCLGNHVWSDQARHARTQHYTPYALADIKQTVLITAQELQVKLPSKFP